MFDLIEEQAKSLLQEYYNNKIAQIYYDLFLSGEHELILTTRKEKVDSLIMNCYKYVLTEEGFNLSFIKSNGEISTTLLNLN
jgi:hypothetical protein